MAALTGPSGSGKTSLLTVLAALQAPDAGEVRYDGRPVTPRTRDPWTGGCRSRTSRSGSSPSSRRRRTSS
ncbi:MAG: ATP-binding cassette domain-containing protein [Amnibacterium sp.]